MVLALLDALSVLAAVRLVTVAVELMRELTSVELDTSTSTPKKKANLMF